MIRLLQRFCLWFLSRHPVPEPVVVPDDEPVVDPGWFYDDDDFCDDPACVGMDYPRDAFRGPNGECLCSTCAFDTVGSVRVRFPWQEAAA